MLSRPSRWIAPAVTSVAVLARAAIASAQPPSATKVDPTLPAASADVMPRQVVALEGLLSLGPFLTYGGSLRYEHRILRQTVVLGRLGAMQADAITAPSTDVKAAYLHVGIRRYGGGGAAYLGIEGGPALASRDATTGDFDEMIEGYTKIVPSVRATAGIKFSGVDLGVSILYPYFGAGVHMSWDIFTDGKVP